MKVFCMKKNIVFLNFLMICFCMTFVEAMEKQYSDNISSADNNFFLDEAISQILSQNVMPEDDRFESSDQIECARYLDAFIEDIQEVVPCIEKDCLSTFATLSEFKDHLVLKHKICLVCMRAYVTRKDLYSHLKICSQYTQLLTARVNNVLTFLKQMNAGEDNNLMFIDMSHEIILNYKNMPQNKQHMNQEQSTQNQKDQAVLRGKSKNNISYGTKIDIIHNRLKFHNYSKKNKL